MVEYREGHAVRVELAGHEPFEASEKKVPFVLLKVSRRLNMGDQAVARTYRGEGVTKIQFIPVNLPERPPYNQKKLPELLFLGAGGMTMLTLALLWWQLPDLFLRTFLWLRGLPRYRLEIAGMLRLPDRGPVLLVTDAADAEQCSRVLCATDRVTYFLYPDSTNLEACERRARQLLDKGAVVGLSLPNSQDGAGKLLEQFAVSSPAPVLPVHYAQDDRQLGWRPVVYVLAGTLLPAGSGVEAVRGELQRLHEDLQHRLATGAALEKVEEH
jgi:hypothetical protein